MSNTFRPAEEATHLRNLERPIDLEWEALDLNHRARYYAFPAEDEEDLARHATDGSRVLRAREDPLKLLWNLD